MRFCLASKQKPWPSSSKNSWSRSRSWSSRCDSLITSLGFSPRNSNTYGSRTARRGAAGSAPAWAGGGGGGGRGAGGGGPGEPRLVAGETRALEVEGRDLSLQLAHRPVPAE